MTNEQKAQRIKMILMDVDGTLTDGSLLLLSAGEELKSYNVRDGMGILIASLAGLKTGIITGKISEPLKKRAEKLKILELHQGILDKKSILLDICQRHALEPEDIAYIGDDLGDLDIMEAVGFSGAVGDAHPKVIKQCHYQCSKPGGKGAVREFIEFIINAQGKWNLIEEKISELTKIK
ncbi:MAG: KdsC family phosphatase [Acidobacteriota bacterium]